MAEFCLDCAREHLGFSKRETEHAVLSKDHELCEGCGQMRNVVVRIGWLKRRRFRPTDRHKYLLISVCDREILTEQFDSLKAAQITMHQEMISWGKVPEEIFVDREEYEEKDDEYGFTEHGGWANDGFNHADFDWSIIEI